MLKLKERTTRLFTGVGMKLSAAAILLSPFVLSGCNQTQIKTPIGGEGTISFSSITVDSDIQKSKTRITEDDLKLRIENTRGEILRTWENVADVPERISAVAGSYKVVGWNGETSLLPSFTDDYFVGEEKFAVTEGEETAVSLVVKYGTTKVLVNFDDESFGKYYQNYSLDLRTTTPADADAELLTYDSSTTDQEGNFLPGTLRLRLNITTMDGEEMIFYPKSIPNLGAAERRTLNLAVSSTTGNNSLTITTDDGYSYTEEIELMLPGSSLPKPAPTITPLHFELGETIEGAEAVTPQDKYSATILATAGIESVKVRTTTQSVIDSWGGKSELEFVGASNEIKAILSGTGFRWDNSLLTAEEANAECGRVNISFGDMFACLKVAAGENYSDFDFELEVLDIYGQSNKNSATEEGTFKFTVRVYAPTFGWEAPTAGNIWGSFAEFDIHCISNTDEVAEIWIKEGENGEWKVAEEQTFVQDASKATGYGVQVVKGLNHNSNYSFRLVMGNQSTEDFTMTTEAVASIPNGDMEDWQAKKLGTSLKNIPYYNPNASGEEYWDTNNDRTTSYRQWACVYAYNCFPAVSYTFQAYDGTYAAELRSVSASNISLNTRDICYDVCKTAGKLLIGDFTYSDKKDHIDFGKPFATRPESFSFYYTYVPQENTESFTAEIILYNGTTEIGKGTFVSQKGAAVNNYTHQVVDIEYSNRRLRADKMGIIFQSTNQSPAPVHMNHDVLLDYAGEDSDYPGWESWNGATLRIDNVEVQCE